MIQRLTSFYRQLSSRDRALVFVVVLAALLLSTIPYIFGYVVAGAQYEYLSLNPLGSADTNVYFSFIHQIAHGKVLVENLHTSEVQHGSIFHPLWLILGWISGLFQLSAPVVFHAARIVIDAALLVFVYFFLGEVFPDSRRRNIALVLIAFSSGIGVFFSLGVSMWDPVQSMLLLPSDQWIPESNTFLTLLHSPLFPLSQLLLLIMLWIFLHEDEIRSALVGATTMLLFALIHPYDMVTVGAVGVAFLLALFIRDTTLTPAHVARRLRRLMIYGLSALPAIIYLALIGKIEPAIGGWTRQNITTSPMLHSYILGYGLLLVFGVAGFVALRRSTNRAILLVLTWMITGALLLYIPIQINRRFTNGLHIPIAIVAAVGLDIFWRWLQKRYSSDQLRHLVLRAGVAWVIVLGIFFSTLTTLAKSMYWMSDPARSIYHLRKSVVQGMDWLGMHAPQDAVILSHSYHGNIIPARSGRRVFVGHGHQTVDWTKKRALVTEWFFRTNTEDAEKEDFLRRERISYIFFADLEDGLGNFAPEEKAYLVLVFQAPGIKIYRLR